MRIRHDVDLQPYNTFALSAYAATLVDIHHPADLTILHQQSNWSTTPRWILSGGSNLILTQDWSGYVLKIANLGKKLIYEDDQFGYWQVAAGENWHEWVQFSLAAGYSGLENLSLIPGTVGAAPVQNIGAYGVELADTFVECEATDLATGKTALLTRLMCRLGYRDSIFKQVTDQQWVITQVTFRLNKQPQLNIRYGELKTWADAMLQIGQSLTPLMVSEQVCAIRRKKLPDPQQLPNAGSFFKNPIITQAQLEALKIQWPDIIYYPIKAGKSVKLAAGWLLERLGWKGYRQGPVGFHEQQSLVMVNYGGARGSDVLALAQQVQAHVLQEVGIALEIEPKIID